MNFLEWIGLLFTAATGVTVALFRHYYMPSTDHLTEIPLQPPIPPAPPPPKPDYIEIMAKAMQEFEGYFAPSAAWPKGSPAYRCNNPGNIKDIHGVELHFPTYEAGFDYLKSYLVRACTGKHPAFKPYMTLMQFYHVYTGDPEPSPTDYAIYVSTALGLPVTTPIKDVV